MNFDYFKELNEEINYELNDTLYSGIQGELQGIQFPTYRVTNIMQVTRGKELHTVYTLTDIFGKCNKEDNLSIQKYYITYREMCDNAIDMNRDGLPYRREFSLVIRGDELENPEYYI